MGSVLMHFYNMTSTHYSEFSQKGEKSEIILSLHFNKTGMLNNMRRKLWPGSVDYSIQKRLCLYDNISDAAHL